jgi:membrane protease YdiL (CAAX protease family)
MPALSPAILVAACLTLLPFLATAFIGAAITRWAGASPVWLRNLGPAVLCIPYVLVALSAGIFRWGWFAVYLLVPVTVAGLLWQAGTIDPEKRGNWRDYLVLLGLGLAVDLRWLEPAWPAHLAVFNKMLLLDAGIYGFLVLRQLDGVGFDLRLRWRDIGFGVRELAMYTPIALILGLSLGFLHLHPIWPRPIQLAGFFFTFFFIAVPEELFFRGWMQNLLERRIGRYSALPLTAALFGLSHFNKRATHFNWRYVLLAAIAGIFYGRAWLEERRVGASAITHASVDTIWSIWLR